MVGGIEVVRERSNLHHLLAGGKAEAADQLQLSFSPAVRAVAPGPGGQSGVEDVVYSDPVSLECRHLPTLSVHRPQPQSMAQASLLYPRKVRQSGVRHKLTIV